MLLIARNRAIRFPRRPLVMGIVNLGADSFSGDAITDPRRAVARAKEMIAEGADIIDVGAESARTNRPAIGEGEEMDRLAPFIEEFSSVADAAPADPAQVFPPWLSINTWRPSVASGALALGGEILNDIGGLPTDENARLCAQTGAALLIMHSVGEPKIPHTHVGYDDIMETLDRFFTEKLAAALRAGLPAEAVILDPGLDFAKQREANLTILRKLALLQKFDRPLLLPVSRKTVIGDVLGIPKPEERDAGTIACLVSGLARGAAIFRVHNVRAAAQAIRLIAAIEGNS